MPWWRLSETNTISQCTTRNLKRNTRLQAACSVCRGSVPDKTDPLALQFQTNTGNLMHNNRKCNGVEIRPPPHYCQADRGLIVSNRLKHALPPHMLVPSRSQTKQGISSHVIETPLEFYWIMRWEGHSCFTHIITMWASPSPL